jgi:hypothetical protein
MKQNSVLAALVLVIAMSCSRPAHVIWQQRYDSGQGDCGSSVATDGNDIIVGGICRDTSGGPSGTAWELLRYNKGGKLLWHRVYNRGRRDSLMAVAVGINHDIVGVGCAASNTTDTVHLLLAKFSPQGDQKWEKEYAFGPATRGSALGLNNAGNIEVCGSVNSGDPLTGSDILVARFDSTGSLLDRETLDFGSDEFGQSLIYASYGALVAGIRTPRPGEPESLAAQDIVNAAVGPDGEVRWRRQYGSGDTDLRVCQAWLGNFFLGVTARDTGGTFTRLVEYGYPYFSDPSLHDMRYPAASNAVCMAMVPTRSHAVIGVGAEGAEGKRQCLVWRFFRGKFSTVLPGSGYLPGSNEQANAVTGDADGNTVITGTSGSGAETGILTIKLAFPRYRPPPYLPWGTGGGPS